MNRFLFLYACNTAQYYTGTEMRCNFSKRQEMAISLTEKPENQSIVTEEQEYKAAKLYAWSQALALKDTGQFPSTADT